MFGLDFNTYVVCSRKRNRKTMSALLVYSTRQCYSGQRWNITTDTCCCVNTKTCQLRWFVITTNPSRGVWAAIDYRRPLYKFQSSLCTETIQLLCGASSKQFRTPNIISQSLILSIRLHNHRTVTEAKLLHFLFISFLVII